MRILLVEDEPSAAQMLAKGLREEAYAVDVAGEGERALELAFVNDYDLVILDVMLPRKGGFEVCRELRARGAAVPVLMLTARDAVEDRVAGLDAGADDYLPKPFDFEELLARVRALLRRRPALYPEVINVADLSIDTRARRARRRGRDVELTAKEYALSSTSRGGPTRWWAAPTSPSTSGTNPTTPSRRSSKCSSSACAGRLTKDTT